MIALEDINMPTIRNQVKKVVRYSTTGDQEFRTRKSAELYQKYLNLCENIDVAQKLYGYAFKCLDMETYGIMCTISTSASPKWKGGENVTMDKAVLEVSSDIKEVEKQFKSLLKLATVREKEGVAQPVEPDYDPAY